MKKPFSYWLTSLDFPVAEVVQYGASHVKVMGLNPRDCKSHENVFIPNSSQMHLLQYINVNVPDRRKLSFHSEAYFVRTPTDSVRLSSTGRTVCGNNQKHSHHPWKSFWKHMGVVWLTLPLMVSCSCLMGVWWSLFSSSCQAMTKILPTWSFSADLREKDNKSQNVWMVYLWSPPKKGTPF